MIDRRHAPHKLREALLRILVESSLIVLSILLALAVNEWRQKRADTALAETALGNFATELRHNRDAVETVLPYHREISKRLEDLLAHPEKVAAESDDLISLLSTIAPAGVQPPDLRTTAWETALATNALLHLDYETTFRLAGIYEGQRQGVASTWKGIIEGIFDRRSFAQGGAEELLPFLRLAVAELVAQEEYLLETYGEAIEDLESN